MGQVGQEAPAGVLDVAEAVGHGVERVAQGAQLGAAARDGDPGVVVATAEPAGRLGQELDGMADAAGQVPRDPEGGGERDQQPDGEGDHAGVGEGAFDVDDLGRVGRVARVQEVGVEQRWPDDRGGQAGAGHDGEQDDGLGDEQPGAEPPRCDRLKQAGHPRPIR